jgi:hypothetical protein
MPIDDGQIHTNLVTNEYTFDLDLTILDLL